MADVWVDRKLLLGKQYVYFSRIHSESCISTVKPYFRVRQQYPFVFGSHYPKRENLYGCYSQASFLGPRSPLPSVGARRAPPGRGWPFRRVREGHWGAGTCLWSPLAGIPGRAWGVGTGSIGGRRPVPMLPGEGRSPPRRGRSD